MPKDPKGQISRRSKLNRKQMFFMFAVLLRDKESFRVAKAKLDATKFATGENKPFAIVWDAAVTYHTKYDRLANYHQLLLEVESMVNDDDTIDDDDIDQMNSLLIKAWKLPRKDFSRPQAAEYLRYFLEELLQEQTALDLSSDPLADLSTLLSARATEISDLKSMSGGPLVEPFPTGYENKLKLVVQPTGVPFIDLFLNGGTAAREVYGFVGPVGSCKTTLTVQLAVLRALELQAVWEAAGKPAGKLPIVYVVAWEEPLSSLRMRALGYGANVSRKSMESGDYSTSKTLKPYEKALFKSQLSQGLEVLGERERVNQMAMRLNLNLRFVDFTGGTPELKAPAGNFVDGIATVVDQDQHLRNNPGVGAIYLDYAKAAALKYCMANGLDESRKLRHLIGGMPLAAKSSLAERYGTSVWIMHQLSSEAGGRAPGVEPKSTDTMEAKNFFENVDFGLMVGTVSRENLCMIVGAKTRRAERRKPEIVHVDGNMFRVNATGEKFVVHNNNIMPASDFQSYQKQVAGRSSTKKGSSLSDVGV